MIGSRLRSLGIGLFVCIGLQACAASIPPSARSGADAGIGIASYMSPALAGERTASGVAFDPERMVAAHRTLPFGTRVSVTNVANGREVVVTIVDRGPHRRGRIIDLSPRAARALGFLGAGVARVRIDVVSGPAEARADSR